MRFAAHREAPTSGMSLWLPLVFNRRQRCSESLTNGISASRWRSEIARPAASANRMPVSDNNATSQRISSSVSKHTCCILCMFSIGMGLRVTDAEDCKADYASNTLNKWLRKYVPEGCVVHSFRHSMRDRLRAVQCPADMIDQIGGWITFGVGQTYGEGYSLPQIKNFLSHI